MIGQVVTIQVLPDDALLLIFYFHRILSCPYDTPLWSVPEEWKWHVLVHVCQRWRYLIFASPRHLGLQIVISQTNRYRAPFEHWPPFPISICFHEYQLWPGDDEEDRVIEALKHPDRIQEIQVNVSSSMLEKSTAWVEHSFPELQRLFLRSDTHPKVTVLPSGFLGGSNAAPRKLRHIGLTDISFPTLPQFLLSSPNLVTLSLNLDSLDDMELLSTDAFIAALSTTTQLEYLQICHHRFYRCPFFCTYPERRTASSTSSTRDLIVLRSLIIFDFDGPSELLEDLVSRIDMPLLEQLHVFFHRSFPRLCLDIPQLSRFISKTEHMNSLPHRTSIFFSTNMIIIQYHFEHLPPRRNPILLSFSVIKREMIIEWEASQVLHICAQLSPFTSRMERLVIAVRSPKNEDRIARKSARWVELLGSFRSVQDIKFQCKADCSATSIAHALKKSSTRETTQELFPVLQVLRIYGFEDCEQAINGIEAFVAARKLTGQPLTTVYERKWEYDWDDPGEGPTRRRTW